MFKTFALLAATVSGHSKRDIGSLHSSLEGMLSEVKATYHTEAAYKVAKKARDSDVLSLRARSSASSSTYTSYSPSNSSEGYYNKFTDYYSAPCGGYYSPYEYSDMFRSYASNYCDGYYD
jgi:hypothetical protein